MKNNFKRFEDALSIPPSPSVSVPPSPSVASHHGMLVKERRFRGLRATKRSMKKVLTEVFLRWLVTLAIVVGIYSVLVDYGSYPVMTRSTKREFNALITGLSITLSISIITSLDGMVEDLRWWVLGRRPRSIKKIDLILQSRGIISSILLARITRRFSIHFAVFGWTMIALGSQMALAMMGLCYSVNTADKSALLESTGNITIPDMSSIQMTTVVKSNHPVSLSSQQYTANSYGYLSLAFTTNDTQNMPQPGDLWQTSDPLTFCDTEACQYIFHEKSTELSTSSDMDAVVITSRSVKSSVVCRSKPVKQGGNGTQDVIVITNGNDDETIRIPFQGRVNQTIFMTNTSTECGEGCTQITAFEVSESNPWYYVCNSTVGAAINATLPEHDVGLTLRSLASNAIALQGYDPSFSNSSEVQYQVYPAESVFGTPVLGNATAMGYLISRFSIGVVSIIAQANPSLTVNGTVPTMGTQIDVEHWVYLHIILFSLTGLQLIFGVCAAVVANRVVVPRGGAIAIAQVFKSMMSHDGLCKGTVTGLTEGFRGESRWVFRDEMVSEDGIYDLYMEECGPAGSRGVNNMELEDR